MTVRNGARFVGQAIESLARQTDSNFEIVVVDDGSTDETAEILQQHARQGLTVRTSEGMGRVKALREAIQIAHGSLIAILDADDIALPTRLAVQREYLRKHPDVALLGTGAIEFDEQGEWQRRVVTGPDRVRRALGMYNPFFHSSIMFRRTAYDAVGGYVEDGGWGHDKDLLIRIAARFSVDILPAPLIRYRRHRAQWSSGAATESFRRRKSDRDSRCG
jgi:glycosyltransferase involved in cell wall biosynthesis